MGTIPLHILLLLKLSALPQARRKQQANRQSMQENQGDQAVRAATKRRRRLRMRGRIDKYGHMTQRTSMDVPVFNTKPSTVYVWNGTTAVRNNEDYVNGWELAKMSTNGEIQGFLQSRKDNQATCY